MQSLPGGSVSRSNLLQTFFVLGRVNTKWTGTGYIVDSTSANPLFPLYRYYAETNISANPVGLYANFLNAVYYAQWTNMSHVMDGVVHLVVRAYDPSGYWLTNGYGFRQTKRPQNVWFSPPEWGEVGCTFYSNAVPAAVELQLGVLEDRTLQRAVSLGVPNTAPFNVTPQWLYLQNQSGHVQIFRQRVTIPNVDSGLSMKTAKKFTIYDVNARPTFGFRIGRKSRGASGTLAANATEAAHPVSVNHQSSIINHQSQQGIALVITLIMLSVTLVMAVAFLALAKRERGSVATRTDTTVAQLAADTAVANAQAQIVAGMLSGLAPNGVSSNAYNLHLFVSTNYINPYGFVTGNGSPTNVNYYYANGNMVSAADFAQNVANLWYLPRAPVMISSAEPVGRFYLDLNENGTFDPNGWQPVISDNPNFPYYDLNGNLVATYSPPNVLSNFFVGDPEWVGVLEHPDAPHGPNNPFTSRYAFVAVPAGNALDINYLHNQARNPVNPSSASSDGFMRNQGVGSWEINLAAFLADLNTNVWSPLPLPANLYYAYNEPAGQNFGHAFDDARALLAYRYQSTSPAKAANVFDPTALAGFRASGIDEYSRGPLQTTLDYIYTPNPLIGTLVTLPWSGADNTNHLFAPSDLLDGSKMGTGLNTFTNRLRNGGTASFPSGLRPSYDRYTFYRMLDQIGSDSSPDDGRLNLNYSNALVSYSQPVSGVGSVKLPLSIGIIAGAETNLMRWRPLDFFLAASDHYLRPPDWIIPDDARRDLERQGYHLLTISQQSPIALRDVNSLDYLCTRNAVECPKPSLAAAVLKQVEQRERRGVYTHILAFHELSTTSAVMPELIANLKARGYRFVTLSEYMQLVRAKP